MLGGGAVNMALVLLSQDVRYCSEGCSTYRWSNLTWIKVKYCENTSISNTAHVCCMRVHRTLEHGSLLCDTLRTCELQFMGYLKMAVSTQRQANSVLCFTSACTVYVWANEVEHDFCDHLTSVKGWIPITPSKDHSGFHANQRQDTDRHAEKMRKTIKNSQSRQTVSNEDSNQGTLENESRELLLCQSTRWEVTKRVLSFETRGWVVW
jgi:hypothetical protein